MADYKDKIRKLLALAENPNENEARAALLKARQLMAEHKLSERDIKDIEKQSVKKIVIDDLTYSKRRNPWMGNLAAEVGEKYCCKGFSQHNKGEQTRRIGFIGLESDVEMCEIVFKYARDCILSKIKDIYRENKLYNNNYAKQQCDSYGYGFVNGLRDAFKIQDTENKNKWGLVMKISPDVLHAASKFSKNNYVPVAYSRIHENAYRDGYADGKQFDIKKRISNEEKPSIDNMIAAAEKSCVNQSPNTYYLRETEQER